MRINNIQRNILSSASVVLSLIWLAQVSSEGLKNSHWIIITPLVAGLLVVAFSSRSDKTPVVSEPTITPERLAANIGDEGAAIVAMRFDECANQWQSYLRSSLVDRMPKATAKDRAGMSPFVDMAATKLAFANYLLIILHRGPSAYKSKDLKDLRLHVCERLTYKVHQSLIYISNMVSGLESPSRRDSMTMAQQQMAEYEALVVRCQKNFQAQTPFPLDPLFAKVDGEAKFALVGAADRETFFGMKYREESGRLLHPKAGITALR